MNFHRSAVSLRLFMEKFLLIMMTKLTACRTITFLFIGLSKTCDISGPQGHDWNKFGRGSLDDATALCLEVSDKKIFYVSLYDPQDGSLFAPGA